MTNSEYGLWRIMIRGQEAFAIPMRNEGLSPFVLDDVEVTYLCDLSNNVGKKVEKAYLKMFQLWSESLDEEDS